MTARFRGFTLIELLVVIAIISILTAIGAASYGNAQQKSRDARRKADIKQIQTALELYKADYGHYPISYGPGGTGEYYGWELSTYTGGPWIRDNGVSPATPLSPQYMNQIPVDPFNQSTSAIGPWYGSSNYAYYSYTNGTCTGGQYYWLAALLENHNDPDGLGKTRISSCGYDLINYWDPYTYVVLSP